MSNKFISDDTFGERLRKVRKSYGLTQKEFGLKLGVSLPTVNRLEQSDGWPHEEFLLKLKSKFKCDPTWILTGQGGVGNELAASTAFGVVRNKRIYNLLQAQHADWRRIVECTERSLVGASAGKRKEVEDSIKEYREGLDYLDVLLTVGASDFDAQEDETA